MNVQEYKNLIPWIPTFPVRTTSIRYIVTSLCGALCPLGSPFCRLLCFGTRLIWISSGLCGLLGWGSRGRAVLRGLRCSATLLRCISRGRTVLRGLRCSATLLRCISRGRTVLRGLRCSTSLLRHLTLAFLAFLGHLSLALLAFLTLLALLAFLTFLSFFTLLSFFALLRGSHLLWSSDPPDPLNFLNLLLGRIVAVVELINLVKRNVSNPSPVAVVVPASQSVNGILLIIITKVFSVQLTKQCLSVCRQCGVCNIQLLANAGITLVGKVHFPDFHSQIGRFLLRAAPLVPHLVLQVLADLPELLHPLLQLYIGAFRLLRIRNCVADLIRNLMILGSDKSCAGQPFTSNNTGAITNLTRAPGYALAELLNTLALPHHFILQLHRIGSYFLLAVNCVGCCQVVHLSGELLGHVSSGTTSKALKPLHASSQWVHEMCALLLLDLLLKALVLLPELRDGLHEAQALLLKLLQLRQCFVAARTDKGVDAALEPSPTGVELLLELFGGNGRHCAEHC